MNSPHSCSASIALNLKHLILLVVLFALTLGIIYLFSEAFVIRKILLTLAMPVGFCWLVLLAMTYFSFVNRQRVLAIFCLMVTMIFTLSGNSFVVKAMATPLEDNYRDFSVANAKEYETIVLLGGCTELGYNRQPQLGANGDRVMVALQLFKAGKANRIACTGSSIESLGRENEPGPGELSRLILIRAGVPQESIVLVEGRNTNEELQNLAKLIQPNNQGVGIVSSAWHLPRVMRLAEKHGIQADPIPSNFVADPNPPSLLSLIPTGRSMAIVSKLFKEHLARLLGQ